MAVDRVVEAFIKDLLEEIEDGVVEEENLQRFEDFVKAIQEERYLIQESVKEAYCQVAVYSTAKYLTYKQNSREAYTEAIRRIWLRRIMPLCDKVSVLVTRDLLNAFQKLWAAHNDEEARENLINEKTREKALVSLRKLIRDWIPPSDDENESMYESGETESRAEIEETESMVEERGIEVNQESKPSEAVDKDKDEIGETDSMAEAREKEDNQKCKAFEAVDKEKDTEDEIGETDSMAEAREIEDNQKCKAFEAVDEEKDTEGEIVETDSMVEAREIEANQKSEAVAKEKSVIEETDSMVEAREIEESQKSKASEAVEEEEKEIILTSEMERLTARECETECPPRQIQSSSSAVVKHELVNALKEEVPSNLNNETLTEQEDDVFRPPPPSTAVRPSLMERRSTAHTYEWDDSIDTSAEELSDEGERSNIKRIVVCPMKRSQSSGSSGRRKRTPWTTAETEALMKGYEMYGTNWKQIKDEFPILERRTNGDIKDKFRGEMRREEANPTPE